MILNPARCIIKICSDYGTASARIQWRRPLPDGTRFMVSTRANEPGRQLKRIREKLSLKYRDVTEASQVIARERGSREFVIGLSRLADIENKGTVPSIYRVYTLGAVYGIDFNRILAIFGVDVADLPADSMRLAFPATRLTNFDPSGDTLVELPAHLESVLELRSTAYISRQIQRWGKLPALLLQSLDLRKQRYAFIGTDDWSMHPIIRPGSFVQIDESRRSVKKENWAHEHEKAIYFLEHRQGFRCGWCTAKEGWLIVQSHPASAVPPEIFKFPGEIDVVGQVVGVVMRFDPEKRRRTNS